MNCRCIFLVLALLPVLSACDDRPLREDSDIAVKKFTRWFRTPPDVFRPTAGWVWNDQITKQEIDHQLKDFAGKGFGTILLFPGTSEEASGETGDRPLVNYALRKARWNNLDLRLFHDTLRDPSSGAFTSYPGVISGFSNSREDCKSDIFIQAEGYPRGHVQYLTGENVTRLPIPAFSTDITDMVRGMNSMAGQLGISQRSCIAFSGQGWGLGLAAMRERADLLFVLGMNRMTMNVSLHTLRGNAKYHFPPAVSYQQPFWKEMSSLNDYCSRLSMALSAGRQLSNNLLLVPAGLEIDSIPTMVTGEFGHKAATWFGDLIATLEDHHIEFDLGFSRVISEYGKVENERFLVGEQEYHFVILPPLMHDIDSVTVRLLEKYMENGGSVIALCQPPGQVSGEISDVCRTWPTRYPRQWIRLSGPGDPRLSQYLFNNQLTFISQKGGRLVHMRRQLKDGQLLFLVNRDGETHSRVSMISTGADIAHLDPFTGRTEQYPCVVTDGILSFDAEIPPGGSLLLFLGEKEIRGKQVRKRRRTGDVTRPELSPVVTEIRDDNVLMLDYCSLYMDDDTTETVHFTAMQNYLLKRVREPEHFSSGGTHKFSLQYPFLVDSRFRSRKLRVVVDNPVQGEITINGMALKAVPDEWWLDRGFRVYRVGDVLKPGENSVGLVVDNVLFDSLSYALNKCPQPIYLVGELDVLEMDRGWLLATAGEKSPGSWKQMGMPFYQGSVSYTASFPAPERGPARVRIDHWDGSVAVVRVNGAIAGQVLASPGVLRIDDWIKQGKNTVSVTVTGSLKSLFGPHHGREMADMPVTANSFMKAPSDQPSGIDYILPDYGLFKPFIVELLR